MERVGLYLHVPFCRAKCSYCDFNSYPGLEDFHEPYIRAVCSQVSSCADADHIEVDTVYVGGGTPSVLPSPLLDQVLSACWRRFACVPGIEVTVEANPGTVDQGGFLALRRSGVNRLSLGAQSFRESDLHLLGRIHHVEQTEEAFREARRTGFDNISLDMIYGLPDQRIQDWAVNVDRALRLAPEHLSLYALTLEEGTPLQHSVATGALAAPDPDVAAEMYAYAERRLKVAGYEHYELSNWALPERQCRHNLKYWRTDPYLGFGAGAHSCLSRHRYQNVRDPREFVALVASGRSPVLAEERLTARELMAEDMILGLRLVDGVRFEMFADRHGLNVLEVYASQTAELEQLGLLTHDASGLRLTPRGRLLANQVFVRFWPPAT